MLRNPAAAERAAAAGCIDTVLDAMRAAEAAAAAGGFRDSAVGAQWVQRQASLTSVPSAVQWVMGCQLLTRWW